MWTGKNCGPHECRELYAPVLTFRQRLRAGLQLLINCGTGRAAVLIVQVVSNAVQNVVRSSRSYEIEQLTRQLESQSSTRREEAARLLAAYAAVEPLYRAWVAQEGAIEKMLPLLKSHNWRARVATADALKFLAQDKTVRDAIVAGGAVPKLARLLRRRYNYRLRVSSARALASIAVEEKNIAAILASVTVDQLMKTAGRLVVEITALPGRYTRQRNKTALLSATLELLARLAADREVRAIVALDVDFVLFLCRQMFFFDAVVLNAAMDLSAELVKDDQVKSLFLRAGTVPHLSRIWLSAVPQSQVLALKVLTELATDSETLECLQDAINRTSRRSLSKHSLEALFAPLSDTVEENKKCGVFNLASCLSVSRGTSSFLQRSGLGKTLKHYLGTGDAETSAAVCRCVTSLAARKEFRVEFELRGMVGALTEFLFCDDLDVVESALTALSQFSGSAASQQAMGNPRVLRKLLELSQGEKSGVVSASLELLRPLSRLKTVSDSLKKMEIPIV